MASDGAVAAPGSLIAAFKPQLVVPASKADEVVQFYKAAFGAEEVKRSTHPKRKADQDAPLILSAELKIGSSVLVVSDQIDDAAAPMEHGGGIVFRLETVDVAGAVEKAVKAGAVAEGEIAEEEGACVVRKVKDPFGVVWTIVSVAKGCGDVADDSGDVADD